jgi:hypothetical protein
MNEIPMLFFINTQQGATRNQHPIVSIMKPSGYPGPAHTADNNDRMNAALHDYTDNRIRNTGGFRQFEHLYSTLSCLHLNLSIIHWILKNHAGVPNYGTRHDDAVTLTFAPGDSHEIINLNHPPYTFTAGHDGFRFTGRI